ncbi:aspartyl protease family protein [Bizionia paragorgiae]|uniref:retropepsin-like aspartic protease n=1 Tax=Bizionia paragorgiae TaxID=283786 RepID=UPI003A93A688
MKLCKLFVLVMITCSNMLVLGQSKYEVNTRNGVDKIPFQLINNVIVIPVEINGVKRSFLLDTGVSRPILFNFLKGTDTIPILHAEKIFLKGLGNDGRVEALRSSFNTFKVGNTVNSEQTFYIVFDSSVDFAPKLGVPIHGILGSDFFKDLIVEINYAKQYLKVTTPERYKKKKCKRCETFELQFYNEKPYLEASVTINKKSIPVKLLIDSGSSDALWLFENEPAGLFVGDYYFRDILGYGLSGSVHGKRSKIDAVTFNNLIVLQPKVAFPDPSYIKDLVKIEDRKGSIGGELLKRFNCVFNYKEHTITLKPNGHYKTPFSYNKSGLTVENSGLRIITELHSKLQYATHSVIDINNSLQVKAISVTENKLLLKTAFTITQVRWDSPAYYAGLKSGDIIILLNGIDTRSYSLQELMSKFYQNEGKKIKLEVDREGQLLKKQFYLKSPLN